MLQPRPPGQRSAPYGGDRDGERTDYLKDREADFLLIEFGKLQDEILSATQEKWRLEHTVILLNILLLAFGYIAPAQVDPHYFALPFAITLLGGMRTLMLWLHLKRAGNYLTKVEEVFGVHPKLGWELRLEKLDESRPYTLSLVGMTVVFWMGLLALTLILAVGYHLGYWQPGA
ncbi:hypothetical protein SAMN02949497_0865 [Methylomagnum ishizawai]|uniref:Uncharacterized protein n=1 Tax=Methylomagnum ishizawai TaxID=1760988 RepID=A0A1Y6CSJ7_9GAMM|nr:hypothetical protein [Methylomagnum ishizawai]SMF93578.1 hypothetical protein SAMN02949497_0865 [Methylomagnum ishizawai]